MRKAFGYAKNVLFYFIIVIADVSCLAWGDTRSDRASLFHVIVSYEWETLAAVEGLAAGRGRYCPLITDTALFLNVFSQFVDRALIDF